MYSPKIDENLIPELYHMAKARGMPMTRLVAQLIRKALKAEILPTGARSVLAVARQSDCQAALQSRTGVV